MKRNKFESVLVRWINLELVIQSEVSQKEKKKYCILMYIYGIQKNGIDEPICREEMDMQMQTMDLWTQWRQERVGWMQKVVSTYITTMQNRQLVRSCYVTQEVQSLGLPQNSGCHRRQLLPFSVIRWWTIPEKPGMLQFMGLQRVGHI